MSTLASKLKFFDLYAVLPSLSFGKEGKIYSRFGFLLTLITIIIIGSMTVFLSIQVFRRQKPFIVQYQLPAQTLNPRIAFNTDLFNFAFATTEPETNSKAFQLYGQIASPQYGVEVSVNECMQEADPTRSYYCFFQPQGSKDKTYLDNGATSTYEINFFQCDPSKTGADCYNSDEMKYWLANVDFILLYDDWIIDPTDYDHPIRPTKNFYKDAFMSNTAKTLLIKLEEIEFISDNGWLFQDFESETKLRASIRVQVADRADNDPTLLRTQIQYSGVKTIYKRTYPKIPDLLAQISGFITIIIPIFFIFVAPYADLKKLQYLVNEIYEIKLNKEPDTSDQKPSSRNKAKSFKYLKDSSTQKVKDVKEKDKQSQEKSQQQKPTQEALQYSSIHVQPLETIVSKEHSKETKLQSDEENIKNIYQSPETPSKTLSSSAKEPSSSSPNREVEAREDDIDILISPKSPGEKAVKDQRFIESKKEEILYEGIEMTENIEEQENEPDQNQKQNPETSEDVPIRTSDDIQVGWSDWVSSLWKPQPKVQILREAKEHLLETLDLINLSKKVGEIDKLKACLLTHDQRVIFENLPSSVIVYDFDVNTKTQKAIKQYHWKESFKGNTKALKEAYMRIVNSDNQRKLDQRLINLYECEYLEDNEHPMVLYNH